MLPVLKRGTLAYYDSVLGLVAARVDMIKKQESGFIEVLFIVTATKARVYKRGELLSASSNFVVPRDAIRRTRYSNIILPYTVEITA